MTDETKKGQWRECEIAGVRHLVWVPPPGSVEDGQPFPFIAHPIEAESKKWPLAPTDDELWRKDYEAARAFTYQVHTLLKMCESYANMLAICGAAMPENQKDALYVLQRLRNNMLQLVDRKIHKQPHRDTVFISPIRPEKE